MDEKILPIAAGDWIATIDPHSFRVARVVRSYWGYEGEENTVFADIVIYELDGTRVGRESPPEGGPTRFEPAIQYTEVWRRIQKPQFPIRKDLVFGEPNADGMRPIVPAHKVTMKAERIKPVKQRETRKSIVLVDHRNFDQQAEIQALRRSAQELRDMARTLPMESRKPLMERAESLDKEAERLTK